MCAPPLPLNARTSQLRGKGHRAACEVVLCWLTSLLSAPGCQREFECGAAVNSVCLHPNQMELISGQQNGSVRIWNLSKNTCSRELVPSGEVAIRSVDIAPNGSTAVAANNDVRSSSRPCAYAWSLTRCRELFTFGECPALTRPRSTPSRGWRLTRPIFCAHESARTRSESSEPAWSTATQLSQRLTVTDCSLQLLQTRPSKYGH